MGTSRVVPATLAVVVLAGVAAWQVVDGRTDEQKIRDCVRAAVSAFNDGSSRRVRKCLSEDWRAAVGRYTLDRSQARILRGLHRGARTPHLQIGEDEPVVLELDAEAGTARATATGEFRRLQRQTRYLDDVEPEWRFDVDMQLRREPDDAWRITRCSVKTRSGRMPMK